MTQHSQFTFSSVVFPLPPETPLTQEHDIYLGFMRHVRRVPSSRIAIKVLAAIQFTADTLSCSDAHVAKVLVDLGLRAPRLAFPAEFLDFADQAFLRKGWEVCAPSAPLLDLKAVWEASGDAAERTYLDKFPLPLLPMDQGSVVVVH